MGLRINTDRRVNKGDVREANRYKVTISNRERENIQRGQGSKGIRKARAPSKEEKEGTGRMRERWNGGEYETIRCLGT